jgi:hypothetical protein
MYWINNDVESHIFTDEKTYFVDRLWTTMIFRNGKSYIGFLYKDRVAYLDGKYIVIE